MAEASTSDTIKSKNKTDRMEVNEIVEAAETEKSADASTSAVNVTENEINMQETEDTENTDTVKFEDEAQGSNGGVRHKEKQEKTVTFQESNPVERPSNNVSYPTRGNRKKQRQLRQLKTEIYELIRENNGVWGTDVCRLYNEHHGKYPDFSAFGYPNIWDFLSTMKDVLSITRSEAHKNNWWLCDLSNPTPLPPKKEPEPEPEPEPVEEVPFWDPCQPEPPDFQEMAEEALPGVPYDPDVFPEDCMQTCDTIPKPQLPKSYKKAMRVYITSFYSPSHLWLRFSGPVNDDVEEMIDTMTFYYNEGPGATRYFYTGAMRVGMYCAACYQYWLRAVIVRIIDMDHAKLFFVDHGFVMKMNIERLKPLPRIWAKIPAQAVRARQIGVRPPCGGQLWSRYSSLQFENQIRGRALIARILRVDKYERVLEVNLKNLSTREIIDRKLVIREGTDHRETFIESGLAEPEALIPKNSEKPSYYYPKFEVLEAGATPSYQELAGLFHKGIEPEDIPSFVKHVPPLKPIRCPTPPHLTADIEDFNAPGPSRVRAGSAQDFVMSWLDASAAVPLNEASGSAALDPVTSGAAALDLVTSGAAALDPVTSGAAALDPVTTGAAALDPVTSGAAALDPVTSGAAALDPVASGAAALDPVTSGAAALDPVTSGAAALDPVTSGAAALDPVASGAAALDPVTSGAAALDPVASGAAALDPVASGAAALDPVTSGAAALDPVTSGCATLDSLTSDFAKLNPVTSGPMTHVAAPY